MSTNGSVYLSQHRLGSEARHLLHNIILGAVVPISAKISSSLFLFLFQAFLRSGPRQSLSGEEPTEEKLGLNHTISQTNARSQDAIARPKGLTDTAEISDGVFCSPSKYFEPQFLDSWPLKALDDVTQLLTELRVCQARMKESMDQIVVAFSPQDRY